MRWRLNYGMGYQNKNIINKFCFSYLLIYFIKDLGGPNKLKSSKKKLVYILLKKSYFYLKKKKNLLHIYINIKYVTSCFIGLPRVQVSCTGGPRINLGTSLLYCRSTNYLLSYPIWQSVLATCNCNLALHGSHLIGLVVQTLQRIECYF